MQLRYALIHAKEYDSSSDDTVAQGGIHHCAPTSHVTQYDSSDETGGDPPLCSQVKFQVCLLLTKCLPAPESNSGCVFSPSQLHK